MAPYIIINYLNSMNEEQTEQFVVAVAAIIIKGNKLLMMKRSSQKIAGPNIWETLSGRVDLGEDPYEAILREIQEESSLKVEVEKRPIDLYMTKRLNKPMLLIVYRAKYLSGEVVLSEEHSEYLWATLSEFKEKSVLKRLVKSATLAFDSLK